MSPRRAARDVCSLPHRRLAFSIGDGAASRASHQRGFAAVGKTAAAAQCRKAKRPRGGYFRNSRRSKRSWRAYLACRLATFDETTPESRFAEQLRSIGNAHVAFIATQTVSAAQSAIGPKAWACRAQVFGAAYLLEPKGRRNERSGCNRKLACPLFRRGGNSSNRSSHSNRNHNLRGRCPKLSARSLNCGSKHGRMLRRRGLHKLLPSS